MLVLAMAGLGIAWPVAAQPGNGTPASSAFSTRLGTFTPQQWSALAGWSQESHAEALDVFQQTCRSLRRRETWRATCATAKTVRADAGAARAFFENEFVPYAVTATEQGKDGLMTGYFEPILDGSAVRQAPFIVPVYGTPSDLLYLDARRWQGLATDGSIQAVISNGQIMALAAGATGLQVDPAVFDSEPLDRRYRVRQRNNRIVPYWTRQEIDAGAPIGARVLAWVDDAQALYLMQVQGSGQIRLPDGKTVRLSYSDQNGHPFRPRGRAVTGTRTRGLAGVTADPSGSTAGPPDATAGPPDATARPSGATAGPSGANAGNEPEPVAVATPVSMRTLSMVAEPSGAADSGTDDAVNRIVDTLLAQPPQKAGTARKAGSASGSLPGASEDDARTTMNLSRLVAAREQDPSYVFFQPAQSGDSGPVGALGVPLTATRSIAVDPRSTPLGAPVFIEAERDDSSVPLRRLMIAQDTGGAIRGAVRADFFWGTGPKAGAQAVRTKDDLAMWVLLPRNFTAPTVKGGRTRGIGGAGAAAGAAATGALGGAECVIPDAEYCVD